MADMEAKGGAVPPSSLARPPQVNELQREFASCFHSAGFSSYKRNNLHYVDDGVLLFASGNTVHVVDVNKTSRGAFGTAGHRIILGLNSGGIGALAVHPSRRYFAVGEKGTDPRILIYSFPALSIVGVLKGGAQRAIGALAFAPSAPHKLASVGGQPDYMLTVWDWRQGHIMLHAKAFSQDVYRVAFDPNDDGSLVTSGTGHIRFWRMADTFTGLKLQGDLGKFGGFDLSDISAFVRLPRGSVMSGSETGHLLMWDGNLIQYRVQLPGGRPCHDGPIEYISYDSTSHEIISGGRDGLLKCWPYDKIEFAEAGDDSILELEPDRVVQISPDCQIMGAVRGSDHIIVHSLRGEMFKVLLPLYTIERLFCFHAGEISAVCTSPNSHVAVTCGVDGSVRVWDVALRKMLFQQTFSSGCRSMLWLPASVDPLCRHLAIGFQDGVLRVLKRFGDGFALVGVFKPHTAAVTELAVSPDGQILTTASEDGTLFLFHRQGGVKFVPLGLIHTPAVQSAQSTAPARRGSASRRAPRSLSWSADSTRLLVVCGSEILEYEKPPSMAVPAEEERDTFVISVPFRSLAVRPTPMTLKRAFAPEQPPETAVTAGDAADGDKETPSALQILRSGVSSALHFAPEVAAVRYADESGSALWVTLVEGAGSEAEDNARSRVAQTSKEADSKAAGTGDDETITAASGGDQGPSAASAVIPPHMFMYRCSIVEQDVVQDKREVLHAHHSQDDRGDQQDAKASATTQQEAEYYGVVKPNRCVHLGGIQGHVSLLTPSHTGKHLLLGSSGGTVQARPADSLDYHLSVQVHDGEPDEGWARPVHAGCVSGAALTFDDKILCTTGADGNFFVHRVDIAGARDIAPEVAIAHEPAAKRSSTSTVSPEDTAAAKRVRMAHNQWHVALPRQILEQALQMPEPELEDINNLYKGVTQVDDITDPNHYSIEEEKQRRERDDRMAAAQRKKDAVRKEIQLLRQEFQALVAKNMTLPETERVPAESFELDPELRRQLEAEAQRKVEEVRLELAWITEKRDRELAKVKSAFIDRLVCEHIRIQSFRSQVSLCSFRTAELPGWLQQSIEEVKELIRQEVELSAEQQERQWQAELDATGHADENNGNVESKEMVRSAAGGARRGKQRGREAQHSRAVNEAQQRKLAREERKRLKAELEANRPDDQADDPVDVRAIEEAKTNMGEYKLKSSPDYKVPASQRVDAEKKRRQMILLQESMYFLRMNYNDRFKALRHLKARIIENVTADNMRLREIAHLLGLDPQQDIVDIREDPSEWPERRLEYSQQDLDDFVRKQEEEAQRKEKAKRSQFFHAAEEEKGGVSADGKSSSLAQHDRDHPPVEAKLKRSVSGRAVMVTTSESGTLTVKPQPLDASDPKLSSLERAELSRQRKLLQHERSALLRKIDRTLASFDEALYHMRREKLKLDVDLKMADMKLLTLYQELILLQGFQEQEDTLSAKLQQAKSQKERVRADLGQCLKLLQKSKQATEEWEQKLRQLEKEFDTQVGGHRAQNYEELRKVFEKPAKLKKRSRAGTDGQESGDESGSDAESSASGESSDGDESDGDSRPPNIPREVFEKVLDLREEKQKLDQEREDLRKDFQTLQKQSKLHEEKQEAVDKELEATEEEIQQFQGTKQRALNQVGVIVPLRLSQVHYLENERLPADIGNAIIFSANGLRKLHERIRELQDEKLKLREQFKELKRSHKELLKELQDKQGEIEAEEKKCEEVQVLKFGKRIDLSVLEKVAADPTAEDKRAQLKRLEKQSLRKVREWERKIAAAKDEMARVTEENTKWLQRVGELTKTQYELEDQLNATSRNVRVSDTGPTDFKAERERERLTTLVQMQEQEIEALKAEIHVLSRKGGQIYAPIQ